MVSLSFLKKMKLITHNMLSSQGMKGVKQGYPLKIEVSLCTKYIATYITNYMSGAASPWNVL